MNYNPNSAILYLMGRERAEIYRIGEKERQITQKALTENQTYPQINHTEIAILKPKSASEKYGYATPTRLEQHKKVTLIREEDPQKMMQKAADLYGERTVSSIEEEVDPRNLRNWFDNQDAYSLAGNPDRSLTKIAISIDFAQQMAEKGIEKDAIRKTFVERQPKLGDLSLSTALARIGPEDIGTVHEIAISIAQGDTKISTKTDEKNAKKFIESYTLPGTSRGH